MSERNPDSGQPARKHREPLEVAVVAGLAAVSLALFAACTVSTVMGYPAAWGLLGLPAVVVGAMAVYFWRETQPRARG